MTHFDQASVLYYSDDPEMVHDTVDGNREGVLFDFDIAAQQQARLLLYHVNGDPAQRFIVVRLFNATRQPQTLECVTSLPAGSTEYVRVGHAATAGFLRSLLNQDWRGISLAPNENVVLVSTALQHLALAVGLVEFRSASDTVRCSVMACSDLDHIASVAHAGRTFRSDGRFRQGRFPLIALRTPIEMHYDSSGPEATVKLGDRNVPNEQRKSDGSPGQALKGEYGVFTHLNASLSNSEDAPMKVALYESAHGGESTATYVIDGRVVESAPMPSTDPPPRFKIATYDLAPRGAVTSNIITMPDAGSSSPLVLSFGEDDGTPEPGTLASIITIDQPVG